MRTRWLFLLVAGLAGVAVPASAAVRDLPLSGFDRVDLSGVAAVAIHTGGGFSVHADGDPSAIDALLIEKRGSTLVIGHKPGAYRNQGELRVAVALPRLAAASASGAGSITVDRVTGPDFMAELSGTGSIKLPAVAVGRLRIGISGAGSATVAGRAGQVDLTLSGTGSIDARSLVASGGRLSSSGVGAIHARVDGPVDVHANGIGSVTVAGQPRCTVSRSGLGSVHCG